MFHLGQPSFVCAYLLTNLQRCKVELLCSTCYIHPRLPYFVLVNETRVNSSTVSSCCNTYRLHDVMRLVDVIGEEKLPTRRQALIRG